MDIDSNQPIITLLDGNNQYSIELSEVEFSDISELSDISNPKDDDL